MSGKPAEGSGKKTATLVIQTAFPGDVILTIPLLQRLAERHGAVDVVTTPGTAPLLEAHPAVRQVIRYDKRGGDRGWSGFTRLARRLRGRRYARVFLPHRSWRSAGLALIAGIPERIGFADSPAALTYTSRVRRAASGHEVSRLLALAGPPTEPSPAIALGLTAEERETAARWLGARGIPDGFVALAPGSIWGTKKWPYYRELAAQLGAPIVVIGGPDDVDLGDQIVRRVPDRAHSAAGALTLRQSAALLERAALLVTNDSAPLHLATAVGTPIVAIFGPTVPEFGFGPLRPTDLVVQHSELPCRPCSRHGPQVCPLGHHRCMKEISVDVVVAAVGERASCALS